MSTQTYSKVTVENEVRNYQNYIDNYEKELGEVSLELDVANERAALLEDLLSRVEAYNLKMATTMNLEELNNLIHNLEERVDVIKTNLSIYQELLKQLNMMY